MNKKLLGILIVIIIVMVLSLPLVKSNARQPVPTPDIPDTAETRQVMKAVQRAYEIERQGGKTFNFERFDQAFINDPRFPMPPETLQVVREFTHNPSLESAGYLDYKLAYYTWWRDGVYQREALQESAKAENRNLTDDERESLVDEYGRSAPARPPQEPQQNVPSLIFISVEVNQDIAIVKLDDGPTISELTLVLVDHRWYIADLTILRIKA